MFSKEKAHFKRLSFFVTIFSVAILFSYFNPSLFKFSRAETREELERKISEQDNKIKDLEKEIQKFQAQAEALNKEADSLSKAIKVLDLSRNKLLADIKVTENKISSANLYIAELNNNIGDKAENIETDKIIIAESLRNIHMSDNVSVVEQALSSETFADSWLKVENFIKLQDGVKDKIADLKNAKTDLENNKKKTESKKVELLTLRKELNAQKALVDETTKEKNALLRDTKNTEADYKALVADRQAKKDQFEKEMESYEAALKIAIDPSRLPSVGMGILKWPLAKIFITQYFGSTPFATKNPQVYSGRGHNGVDFRASIGTPVMAALDGIVKGTGNTDLVRGCYSYGKWILIEHENGISTLYGHLSYVSVSAGQKVSTSDIIGYSGNTGYSTGPHLHFGVYASQGVRVTRFESSKNCKNVILPLADPQAYLNPLSYL